MILAGSITSALTSFAGLGLALILEADGAQRVRLGWTDEEEPRMVVTAAGLDDDMIAAAVHRHAEACTREGSWVQSDLDGPPWNEDSAVFSPRIKSPHGKANKATPSPNRVIERWRALQEARHCGIDREGDGSDFGEGLEFIGALGEPAYWRFRSKDPVPDEGASRWEMKTRNRGEEFVGNRLRRLAEFVAARDVDGVRNGLEGRHLIDEAYKGKRSEESRTPTGLTTPRWTDSALAWCALWGIASFPVIHRVEGASVTAAAAPVGKFTPEALVLPVLVGPHSLHRWRTLLVSDQLIRARSADDLSARTWMASHGARAVITFAFHLSDNANAPERSLGVGELDVLGEALPAMT